MAQFNQEGVEVKRLVTVVTITILLVGLILLGLGDTDISVADTNVYDIETTIRQPEASNSSASAAITITMYTVNDGQPSGFGQDNEREV